MTYPKVNGFVGEPRPGCVTLRVRCRYQDGYFNTQVFAVTDTGQEYEIQDVKQVRRWQHHEGTESPVTVLEVYGGELEADAGTAIIKAMKDERCAVCDGKGRLLCTVTTYLNGGRQLWKKCGVCKGTGSLAKEIQPTVDLKDAVRVSFDPPEAE